MTWPKLDEAAYCGPAGKIVRALAPETEADPTVLLVELLTMFGNAVGPSPYVLVGADKHAARLNVAVVGQSSRARKGHAFNLARWVLEMAAPEWLCRIHGGFGSGEAVVESVGDAADDNQGASDKRLLVREGEFARILQVASRDGATLSEIQRDAWDGGVLAVRTRKSTVTATGSHISVIADITAEELHSKLANVDAFNGFANRYCWWLARRSKKLPSGGIIDEDDLRAWSEPVAEAIRAARTRTRTTRAPEAERAWEILYDLIDDEACGILGAVTARAEAQILRLSLFYALLDQSEQIGLLHLLAATAVWDYSAASARHIFGPYRSGDPDTDKLLEALRDAGDEGLDGTEQHAVFSGHRSAHRLLEIRRKLEEASLITTTQQTTDGRPRVRSFVLLEDDEGANQAKKANQAALLPQLRDHLALDSLVSSPSSLPSQAAEWSPDTERHTRIAMARAEDSRNRMAERERARAAAAEEAT